MPLWGTCRSGEQGEAVIAAHCVPVSIAPHT